VIRALSNLVGGWLVAPGLAHDSASITHNWAKHYKVLARKLSYTKRPSNTRFISVGEQASNSSLLDGLDSIAFASSSHVHSGADITTGTVAEARIDALLARDTEVFGIVTSNDGTGSALDADLLDGMSSSAFRSASAPDEAQLFKETADSLGSTATSERVVFTAPANVSITDVVVEPAAAGTASDTANATITVSRRDATGGGNVTVASRTTQTSGVGRHR
jgi:hypothetical protein